MNVAIFQAWAIAVGGMSSLGSALMVLLLLNREAGPGSAFAFATGYFGSYLSIGALGVFFGAGLLESRQDAAPSPGGAIVACVLGVLLLTLAVQQWRTPPSGEPPPFMAKLDEFGPLKAFAVGALIPAINLKNLAIYLPAVAVLAAASMPPLEAGLGLVSTTVVFCGAMLTPVLIYVVLPRRSAQWLGAIRRWIETNSHKVARVILPLIGSALLAKGTYSLWLIYSA